MLCAARHKYRAGVPQNCLQRVHVSTSRVGDLIHWHYYGYASLWASLARATHEPWVPCGDQDIGSVRGRTRLSLIPRNALLFHPQPGIARWRVLMSVRVWLGFPKLAVSRQLTEGLLLDFCRLWYQGEVKDELTVAIFSVPSFLHICSVLMLYDPCQGRPVLWEHFLSSSLLVKKGTPSKMHKGLHSPAPQQRMWELLKCEAHAVNVAESFCLHQPLWQPNTFSTIHFATSFFYQPLLKTMGRTLQLQRPF